MALNIETFSNDRGGNAFFKAIGHPLAADKTRLLLERLRGAGPVAVYDPLGYFPGLCEFHDLAGVDLQGLFVQDVEQIGQHVRGLTARPVTELPGSKAALILVTAFDAERLIHHIQHLLPPGAQAISLDEIRLPDDMLTDRGRYLNNLNFATNIALLREGPGQHTVVTSANYWAGYGAQGTTVWCRLFDEDGRTLAEWRTPIAAGQSIVIDSREVKRRFGLGAFCGSLFLHVTGIAGHDVVKYALDCFGDDDTVLSCTHDANAWPSERYAGLPAPAPGERVILWVQNSHPCPIPAGAVGLNEMGKSEIAWLQGPIPPFGTRAVDVAALLPGLAWPAQVEIQAGKHFVRPRYEVFQANGRSRIAHANVERHDLRPDPLIEKVRQWLGKMYILPAPLLPTARWRTLVLPTPMSTAQEALPLLLTAYDERGQEIARHRFGRLPRDHRALVDMDNVLHDCQASLGTGFGHVELHFDLADAGPPAIDGWLHGIFRYQDRHNGHQAETSFGAHMYNSVLVYKTEPQSYIARPPGLSTRIFLRLGDAPADTFCQLIYAASTPWHPESRTALHLHDGQGREIACRQVRIACGGSLLWRYHELFTAEERDRAGNGAYVLIRDLTCRLFGYDGLLHGDTAFSLDHMFGF